MIQFEDIFDDAMRYLRGEMDEQEHKDFKKLLDSHPHLKEELRLTQLIKLGYAGLHEQEIQQSPIKKSKVRYFNSFQRALITCAAIIIILLLSYWGLRQVQKITPEDDPVFIHFTSSGISSPDLQSEIIHLQQVGGSSNNTNTDQGLAVHWSNEDDLIVTGTFDGQGQLGPYTFQSKGYRDILLLKYRGYQSLEWMATIGGAESPDIAKDICSDSEGNLIVTGGFGGRVNFGGETFQAVGKDNLGNHDFFVAKYTGEGSLRWLSHSGGEVVFDKQTGVNTGMTVACDYQDNIIISGQYIGTPIIDSKSMLEGGPNEDLFIIKYDQFGNVRWQKYITGQYMVYAHTLEVDQVGNILLAGTFGHHNLGGQVYIDGDTLTSFGGKDIFIAKYSPEGQRLWLHQMGSSVSSNGYDGATSMTIDEEGNCIIVGNFVGEAIFQKERLKSYGGIDVFMAKFNAQGKLLWVKQIGSPEGSGQKKEQARGVAIDDDGNIWLTGSFSDTARFDSHTLSTIGRHNFFLAKYAQNGALLNVQSFESSANFQAASGNGLAISPKGKIAITGQFSGTIKLGAAELKSEGKEDIFILVLDKEGRVESMKPLITFAKNEYEK